MKSFTVALVHNSAPDLPPWVEQQLKHSGVRLMHRQCLTPEEMFPWAQEADVIWVMGGGKCVTADSLLRFPKCGALLRSGSGTDNVPVDAATHLGILVANTPGAIAHPVADHAVALLLAADRRIVVHDRDIRKGEWHPSKHWPTTPLQGKTLGLVGFGHIAQLVAKKLAGFEFTILAFDPFFNREQLNKLGVRKVELDEMLPLVDYLSLHCPLSDKTHHLIGEAQLRQMKPSAIIVNTSRGPIIDEKALIQALRENRIAGAALDVTETEPLPASHPLRQLENVIVTPHTAANTQEVWDTFLKFSVETLIDLSRGQLPRSCVNSGLTPRWKLARRPSDAPLPA